MRGGVERPLRLAVVFCLAACSRPGLPAGGGIDAGPMPDSSASASEVGVDAGAILDPGRVSIHRLNNTEYDHTILDLRGPDAQARPTSMPDEEGQFDNDADAFTMNDPRYAQYSDSADALSDAAFADATLSWRIVTCTPASAADTAFAAQIIRTFGARAWRRPLTDDEVTTLPPASRRGFDDVPADYDRDAHANIMIDLMALALACDATRVISFMLDDARSDFVYNFLQTRLFTATGSSPGTAPCPATRPRERGRPDEQRLRDDQLRRLEAGAAVPEVAALPEANGRSVLDNSVVWFGSGMHDGANHRSPTCRCSTSAAAAAP